MTSITDKKSWNTVHKSMLPKPSSYDTFSKKSQLESKKLEEENQKMEERLNAFKNYLKSEKEKRLHANKIWTGGEVRGSLSTYAQSVLAKKKSRKIDLPSKISYLRSDSNLSLFAENSKILAPKPPSAPKTINDQKDMWRIPSSLGRYSKTPSKMTYADRINGVNSFQKSKKAVALACDQDVCKDQEKNEISSSQSLLQGTYDEMESQLSFQRALAEWRGEKEDLESRIETPNSVNLQTGSTQTTFEMIPKSSESLKELEKQVGKLLMDSSSVSYMDRILLSKLKAESEEYLLDDNNMVASIMEETPPFDWTDALDEFTNNESRQFNIPQQRMQVITIYELGYDDCFVGDEVLDSTQIIIEEPSENST